MTADHIMTPSRSQGKHTHNQTGERQLNFTKEMWECLKIWKWNAIKLEPLLCSLWCWLVKFYTNICYQMYSSFFPGWQHNTRCPVTGSPCVSPLSTLQIPQFSHLTSYESNGHKSPAIAGVTTLTVSPNTRVIKIIKICLTAAWVTKWRDLTTTRATDIRWREESGEYKILSLMWAAALLPCILHITILLLSLYYGWLIFGRVSL